ncbi:Nitronate monooxygenase [Leucoagaricus sp. SymC.cos]|nr:Nitronate monooxygenase [Leucoagaricus sp. SymC.cos]
MATAAGGSLAAQVTVAGGFGFIGAALYTTNQLAEQIAIARSVLGGAGNTPLKIGVGFLGWVLDENEEEGRKAIKVTLDSGVVGIWFAFGNDLYKWVEVVRKHDVENGKRTLIFVQFGLLEDVRIAVQDWKVDVIVAQGAEAGGHGFGAAPALKTLLPSVLSITPKDGPIVVGAGGITTGKQIADILSLGATGVAIGTRFCLTPESVYPEAAKQAIIAATSDASVRSVGFDQVAGYLKWPKGIDGRALRNDSLDGFEKGEDIEVLRSKYKEAYLRSDTSRIMVWAGASVGLMNEIKPAKELVEELWRECLASGQQTPSLLLSDEFKTSRDTIDDSVLSMPLRSVHEESLLQPTAKEAELNTTNSFSLPNPNHSGANLNGGGNTTGWLLSLGSLKLLANSLDPSQRSNYPITEPQRNVITVAVAQAQAELERLHGTQSTPGETEGTYRLRLALQDFIHEHEALLSWS